MTLKSKLTILFSTIAVFIISFFTWYFVYNIYEVKYSYDFDPSKLESNVIYTIKCIGVNSLGWEIKLRDSKFSYSVDEGINIIKIFPSPDKNSLHFSLIDKGQVRITLNSEYALNPTKILLISK